MRGGRKHLHWGLLLPCRTSLVGQRMHVQLLELAVCTCIFLLLMALVASGHLWCSVWGGNGLITLTLKYCLSNLPPQKLLAAMSSLELSSVAMLRVVNVSSERRCRQGFTLTSWQTSVRRLAIRSRFIVSTYSESTRGAWEGVFCGESSQVGSSCTWGTEHPSKRPCGEQIHGPQ